MKLLGELKEKVDAAESLDEKRKLIAEAGIELTDEELNAISGGAYADGIPFDALIGGPYQRPRY